MNVSENDEQQISVNVTIRPIEEADVQQVAAIERSTFSQPWSEKSFRDAINDVNAVLLAAEEAGRIVGYIVMYLSLPEGEIVNVAVAEEHRGKAVGKALMRAMLQAAADKGVKQIYLEVRDSNSAAIHLYMLFGFEQIGVRKDFYDFPREDARIMSWRI